MKSTKTPPDPELKRALAIYVIVTAELVGWVVAGAGIGFLIKQWQQTGPIPILVSGMVGFTVAVYRLVLLAKKYEKQ